MSRPHPHPIAAPATSEEGGRSPQRSTFTGATTTGTVRPAAAESPRHSANDVSTRGGGGSTIHGADHLSGGLYAGAAGRTPPDGFPPDGAQDVYAQGNRGMAIHGTDRMSGELDAGTAAHTPLARFSSRSAGFLMRRIEKNETITAKITLGLSKTLASTMVLKRSCGQRNV